MIARKDGSQRTFYASPCSCEFYTTDGTTFLTNAQVDCSSFFFTLDLLIDYMRVFDQRQNTGWFAIRRSSRDKIHVIPHLLSSWQQTRDCSALPDEGVPFLAHLVSLLYTNQGLLRPAAELSPVNLVSMPDETLYCCPPPTTVDIFLCWNSPVLASLSKDVFDGIPELGKSWASKIVFDVIGHYLFLTHICSNLQAQWHDLRKKNFQLIHV